MMNTDTPWHNPGEHNEHLRPFIVKQDVRFQAVMALAIVQGKVAGTIGINTTPGTRHPVMVRQGETEARTSGENWNRLEFGYCDPGHREWPRFLREHRR